MYKTKVLVEQIFDELPRPCEVFILWTGYSSGLDSTSKKKNSEKEPVFITKNGYGDLVVMSIETYEAMVENAVVDTAISEAEHEFERDGQLHDAREALASLRRKHFG